MTESENIKNLKKHNVNRYKQDLAPAFNIAAKTLMELPKRTHNLGHISGYTINFNYNYWNLPKRNEEHTQFDLSLYCKPHLLSFEVLIDLDNKTNKFSIADRISVNKHPDELISLYDVDFKPFYVPSQFASSMMLLMKILECAAKVRASEDIFDSVYIDIFDDPMDEIMQQLTEKYVN